MNLREQVELLQQQNAALRKLVEDAPPRQHVGNERYRVWLNRRNETLAWLDQAHKEIAKCLTKSS